MLVAWNGETLPALDLATEIQLAGRAGFAGIELFVPKLQAFLEDGTVADLKRRLEEAGLRPAGLNCIENFSFRQSHESPLVAEESRWLAEAGQAIGCSVIAVIPSPRPAGMNWADTVAGTAETLTLIAESVAPFGGRIAIEFLEPPSASVRTLSEALEVVEAAGRSDVGIVLDTFHFHQGGSSEQSLDGVDPARLLVVHVNDVEGVEGRRPTDADRLLPGEGVLPLAALLSKVNALGYRGYYSVEVMRPAYHARDPLEYMTDARRKTEAVLRSAGIA